MIIRCRLFVLTCAQVGHLAWALPASYPTTTPCDTSTRYDFPCSDSDEPLVTYPVLSHSPVAFTVASSRIQSLDDLSSTVASIVPPTESGNTTLPFTSAITILNGHSGIQVVTSTDLPVSQTPTSTFATQSNTTGTIVTTVETGGNPPVQPFPTSSITSGYTTLTPVNTTAPFNNATSTGPQQALNQTITVPTRTQETILATSTIASVVVQNTVTLTTATSAISYTTDLVGSTYQTGYPSNSTVTALVSVLSGTTFTGSSTLTTTLAITVVTNGSPSAIPTATPNCTVDMDCYGQDIFLPVGLGQPPSSIEQRSGHPVPQVGILDRTGPIETNKFYANFFLGSQGSSSFTTPYSLSWSKGSGNAMSWGMSVSHVDGNQKVFGPQDMAIPDTPNAYYINPIGIQSIIFSAAELSSSTVLTSDSLQVMSANIHLQPQPGSSSMITFPIVQGMAFVTANYQNLQPSIQSSVFFRNVVAAPSLKAGIFKYIATLEDGNRWLIYAIPSVGLSPNFQLTSSTLLQGMPGFSGSIQVAKNPTSDDTIYDNAVGAYPTGGLISGFADGESAEYSLGWGKGGQYADNTTLLMFALPHHMQSFDNTTAGKATVLQLQTTTKGIATAVVADAWTLQEILPTSMSFAPWRPDGPNTTVLSAGALAAVQSVSVGEASQNMSSQTNLNSMYYSGKGLSKFAQLLYTMNDLADQQDLAAAALAELKECFAVFTNNQQQFPLLYDTDWKGIVSSASYVTGDSGADFGNSYYNDHHFHYGYFIHAAAVIGYLDPSWLSENQDYVNTLVRDVANPSSQDQYFPVFRSFDWYNGHSWAKGLFESGDGKDEESSSEDAMFAYALKMWGHTINDASMEARGNLMLAVLTRSLQSYFLMDSSNTNQPPQFIGNKVTGILFENKADHTTYFGSNLEYIQGIHMIPLMPFSTLTRTEQFVAEEWITFFTDGAVDPASEVLGGWKGILYANYAIINPTAAYDFFTDPNFNPSWLDGGASLSWYTAWAALLGGQP